MRSFQSLLLLFSSIVFAQPAAPPTTPDLPCQDKPGTEEVNISADSGFTTIFNGKDFTGWWNNCNGEDADFSNAGKGGIYKVDPAIHAFYTQQRSIMPGGSAICTNKKYGNHEIILEYWADFGNDAGVYHRTTDKAEAIQTLLDYRPNQCIGGYYPQALEYLGSVFTGCPYRFGITETDPYDGPQGNTGISNSKPILQGELVDPNGWSELRVKIFGIPAHHQVWMRKVGAKSWTQTIDVTWPDLYSKVLQPTGYIGFQVHGHLGEWNTTTAGNWYRNIRIRELDSLGKPFSITGFGAFEKHGKENQKLSSMRAGKSLNPLIFRNSNLVLPMQNRMIQGKISSSGSRNR